MKNALIHLVYHITELIKVKTIITFVVTCVFAKLALDGTISSDVTKAIIIMVFGFYFGTQYDKLSQQHREVHNNEHQPNGNIHSANNTSRPDQP
jgi:hypothetical protein